MSDPNDAPVVSITPRLHAVGIEARVNPSVGGAQVRPAVAVLNGGGHVVAWSGSGVGDADGVFTRLYDAFGAPVGGEVLVNTTVSGGQANVRVAALGGGGYVVTWHGNGPGDADGVFLQRFDAAGATIGGETRVSSPYADPRTNGGVAGLEDGGFIVTWSGLGAGDAGEAFAQLYDAAGDPVGGEFSLANGNRALPAVAALSGGGFVAAWQGNAPGDPDGISVRRFDASGAPVGGEVLVNTTVSGGQANAAVAALGGGYVVTWQGNGPGDADGVFLQRFDAAGAPIGGETRVSAPYGDPRTNGGVAGLADGGFIVTWSGLGGGDAGEAFAQRYDAAGDPVGGEFTLADFHVNEGRPAVAALSGDGFVAAWQGNAPGDPDGILVRRFEPEYHAVEQVALDLKGTIAIADADAGAGALTIMLAVDYGVLALDAGGSGATIVSGNGSASVVVSGTLAQLDALLTSDDASSVTYTADTDTPPASATLTVTADDQGNSGAGGGQSDIATATIAIADVNDAPTLTATAQNFTQLEGAGGLGRPFLHAAASTVEPGQSFTWLVVTVTNAADGAREWIYMGGGFVSLVEGVSSGTNFPGAGLFVNVSGTTATITMLGGTLTASQLQGLVNTMAYFNRSQNPTAGERVITISYLRDNGSGTGPNDNDSVLSVSSTVTVVPVNDEPVVTGLSGDLADYHEGGTAVLLDASSAALLADDNASFAGGALLVSIGAGGAPGEDVLGIDTSGTVSISGSQVSVNGVIIGTLTITGDSLEVAFNGDATAARVEALIQAIDYYNSGGDTPTEGQRTITWIVNDGGGGDNGGDEELTLTSYLNVTAINDAPVLTADGNNPTYGEGSGSPVTLFGNAAASAIEDGQTFTAMTLTATNISGSSVEVLRAGSGSLQLTHGNSVTIDGVLVSCSLAGSFATITFAFPGFSAAELQDWINGLGYANDADAQDGTTRLFAIQQLVDAGSGTPPNENSAAVHISSNVTIAGTNDAAIIGGVDMGDMTEDVNSLVYGQLTIADPDGPAQEAFVNESGTPGLYGTFSVNPVGYWVYQLNQAAVQHLGAGDSVTDTYSFASVDRTPHPVAITIHGANDAAVIGGTDTGDVTEDATLDASGTLTIDDVDTGEGAFQILTDAGGSYGTLQLAANGAWSYQFDNGQLPVQQLAAGATAFDTFQVHSSDGTAQAITITVNGTNDAAIIAGDDAGIVTEDGTLTASGTLSASDMDTGQNSFQARNGITAYGAFSLAANGEWNYELDNALAAVQALAAGATATDTIAVLSQDGTTHHVVITISGTNDAAIIGGDISGSVTEDGSLVASGTLTASDIDTDENLFNAIIGSVAGANGYGSFTLNAAGAWTYTLNNGLAAVQALNGPATLTDTFDALSGDGTSQTVTITINAQNDAPVLTVEDTTVSGTEDANLVFNVVGPNTISVADVDDVSLEVTLTVLNGALTLFQTTGLTFVGAADGTDDATMTFSASAADINAALNGLTYRGNLNYDGADTLSVTVDDGDDSDSEDIAITLADEGQTDGTTGNDSFTGTLQIDYFDLSQGGDDSATGLASNDAFYFGAEYTVADSVDGGPGGNDQMGLQGDYVLPTGFGTITGVEVIALLPGFDYDIATVDANVPIGGLLTIFAGNLGPDDNLTFNGALESDGEFKVFGGQGTDIVTTGAGDEDGIYFGPGRFNPVNDRVNGGTGTNDQLALDGDYTLTLDGTAIQNIDVIALLKGIPSDLAEYNLTLADSLVGVGQTITVWGTPLETALVVNGSLESDATSTIRMFGGTLGDTLTGGAGNDWFWGGLGGDTLTGGNGADTFMYELVAQSTVGGFDRLIGFNDDADKIDLPVGVSISAFAGLATGTASVSSLGTDLQNGITVLGAGQALLFVANAGDLDTRTFLVVDANGTAGFQADGDFVIELVTPVSSIDQLGMFI